MPVTILGSTNAQITAAASTLTFSHTTTSDTQLIMLFVAGMRYQSGNVPWTVSNATFGSNSLSYVGRSQQYTTNRNYTAEIWYLPVPPTGTSNLTINLSTNVQRARFVAVNLKNVRTPDTVLSIIGNTVSVNSLNDDDQIAAEFFTNVNNLLIGTASTKSDTGSYWSAVAPASAIDDWMSGTGNTHVVTSTLAQDAESLGYTTIASASPWTSETDGAAAIFATVFFLAPTITAQADGAAAIRRTGADQAGGATAIQGTEIDQAGGAAAIQRAGYTKVYAAAIIAVVDWPAAVSERTLTVRPVSRLFVVGGGTAMINNEIMPQAYPSSELNYTIDWTRLLSEWAQSIGEIPIIISATWEIDGMIITQTFIDGGQTTAYISGGQAGEQYEAICTIRATAGAHNLSDKKSIYIPVI